MNKDKIRIWHISDTHAMEKGLRVPENIDIVLHSGDISNYREAHLNIPECMNFLDWYQSLEIPYKVMCAGNHDLSIERRHITPGDIHARGITYLENESTNIMGLKIWGSPITPSFGSGWAFNKDRAKLDALWSTIPEDTDIVITHGPAKSVLDLSFDREGNLEMCGCKALRRHIGRVKPKLFGFGHIHNMKGIENNAGYYVDPNTNTIYSNGSCVYDGKFSYGITSHGNIFEIKKGG